MAFPISSPFHSCSLLCKGGSACCRYGLDGHGRETGGSFLIFTPVRGLTRQLLCVCVAVVLSSFAQLQLDASFCTFGAGGDEGDEGSSRHGVGWAARPQRAQDRKGRIRPSALQHWRQNVGGRLNAHPKRSHGSPRGTGFISRPRISVLDFDMPVILPISMEFVYGRSFLARRPAHAAGPASRRRDRTGQDREKQAHEMSAS
jgi:hypothetical protein